MKKIIVLFFTLLTLLACSKDEFDIINLNGNKITVLGHGGMGIEHTYPLNSYESIAYCLNVGAEGTEIDVEMTKDSTMVAFHDFELSERTNLFGNVFNKQWEEVRQAVYKHPIYTGHRVVSLDQIFSGLKNYDGMLFMLDCKSGSPDTSASYRNTFLSALIGVIDRYHLKDQVIVELKREDLIKALRIRRPDIRIFVYTDYERALDWGQLYQLDGITIPVEDVSAEQVWVAHQRGLQVAVLNAHSKSRNIEAIEKNVDIIQTDKVKYLLKVLK